MADGGGGIDLYTPCVVMCRKRPIVTRIIRPSCCPGHVISVHQRVCGVCVCECVGVCVSSCVCVYSSAYQPQPVCARKTSLFNSAASALRRRRVQHQSLEFNVFHVCNSPSDTDAMIA